MDDRISRRVEKVLREKWKSSIQHQERTNNPRIKTKTKKAKRKNAAWIGESKNTSGKNKVRN